MVKKAKGEETELAQKIPDETTEQVTTEPAKTPTLEEQFTNLQKEHEDLTKRYEQTEKGLRTAHSTLTEKDRLLKQQSDLTSRLDGLEEAQKIIAAMIADSKSDDEEEPHKKENYLKRYDEIVERQKEERKQTQLKAQQEEYNQKANDIYSRAKEIYVDDVDALHQIRNFLRNGDLDLAETKVTKAEGSKKVEEKPKETEEQLKSRLEKEILIKHGLLKTETGQPSGTGGSRKPTIDELKASDPFETKKKVDSGEWVL